MLGGIADDGKEDETDKGLGNASTLGNGVDAADEKFRADTVWADPISPCRWRT